MQRLQVLRQGSRSVEDYYKEMEMIMTRTDTGEDEEATIVRFLGSLNKKIVDWVELQHYVELEEMVHMAIKVKNQFKRKGSSVVRFTQGASSSNWKSSPWKKEEKALPTKVNLMLLLLGTKISNVLNVRAGVT